MSNILPVVCFLAGLLAGAVLVWLFLRPAARQAYERGKAEWEPDKAVLTERLQNRDQQYRDLQASLEDARQKLADTFKALSADALQRNNQLFLDLAQATLQRTQEASRGDLDLRRQAIAELVAPVRESLAKVDAKMQEMESARVGAYATLTEQVRSL